MIRADNTIIADDGEPFWRVIVTDTEGLTGVAPICRLQNTGDHLIEDNDGAPLPPERQDTTGVYDCCPHPHLETGSYASAHLLMTTMNRNNVRLCT